jgi:hypothetical protein
MNPNQLARWLALGAGALDSAMGGCLLVGPAFTLHVMGIRVPGAETLLFVRFVGVFVAAVGASYLWAWWRPVERLRVVLGATIFFRGATGAFTGAAVLLGALPRAWGQVTLADSALIGAQAWLLAKGAGRDD